MSDRIIIKACLNGGRRRDQNPNVPYSPEEIAQEAQRCAQAGASVVHFHARTADGGMSNDPAWYAEATRLIREQTDLIINFTVTRMGSTPLETILAYLRSPSPDMIALNMGAISYRLKTPEGARRSLTIPNSYEEIAATVAACRELGITPEPAVFDTGFLSNLATLVNDGVLGAPRYLLLEFASGMGEGLQAMPGDARSYFYLTDCVRALFPQAIWAAHGSADSVFLIAGLAITTGAHVRVGFEDRATLSDGSLARSNADFVAWAAEVARAHGRTPASPAEARALIGLPTR